MSDTKENIKVSEIKNWEESLEKETWISPLVNIFDLEDEYLIEAYLPGVDKENLRIKFEDDFLILMGRIDYDYMMNRKSILQELEMGNYYRKFKVDKAIDENKINARLDAGILRIFLPRDEKSKPRAINIK